MNRKAILGSVVLGLLALAAAGGYLLAPRAPAREAAAAVPAAQFHCPMHPTVVSDRPGDCPICGMRLVPFEPAEPAPGPAGAHDEAAPGVAGGAPEAVVAGRATVQIPAHKQQLLAVTTEPAARVPFRRTVRANARVAIDETRLRHIHTRASGYIERLYANTTGEQVTEGEPILEFYSPEIVASQEEYLVALRGRNRPGADAIPGGWSAANDLVGSAKRRLEFLEMSDGQIMALGATGKVARTITLYAPISGVVLVRNVTQGERIEAGTTLLDIADLSRVWVLASIYEHDLPHVREGQTATMSLPYLPGRTLSGKVARVYPTLDPQTRTVQVRLEFANGDRLLKPEMFAEVSLESDLGERLGVPAAAVLETGVRGIVFVARGEGVFEPREVTIGLRLPDLYEVLDGVREGEQVVTNGNFLIDSESKLKAALAAMGAGTPSHPH